MPEYEVRRCAAGLCTASGEILEPVDMPAGVEPLWRSELMRVAELPAPPRDPAVAAHEAGHAVAFHATGRRIESIRVDLPACVQLTPNPPRGRSRTILPLLAGPAAQLRFHRISYRSHDEDLAPYVEAVKNFDVGGCDRCRALLLVASQVGIDAPASSYFTRYREEEEHAERFVRGPDIWPAIREIADELMREGSIAGGLAHEIAERYVAFGSFCMENENA